MRKKRPILQMAEQYRLASEAVPNTQVEDFEAPNPTRPTTMLVKNGEEVKDDTPEFDLEERKEVIKEVSEEYREEAKETPPIEEKRDVIEEEKLDAIVEEKAVIVDDGTNSEKVE